MAIEPANAIPTGGDDSLPNLETIKPGGEIPNIDPDSSKALDAALLEETRGEGIEDLELDEAAKKAAEEARISEEAKEKADSEAAKVKADADAAKVKADADAKLAAGGTPPISENPPKDKYEDIVLPPYTKPKAAEAFATVKNLAREQAAADAKIIAELTAEKEKLTEASKAAGKLSPEVEKELEELRAFRAGLDVEADPKFKEWDVKVNENVDSIYSKLKSAGVADEVITKIKEMGGPGEVEWDSLSDKLPAQVKRYIEGKLFENEDLIERKKRALETAKSKAAEYVKSKAEASVNEVAARRKGVESKVAELSPKIEWLQEKKAAADAKPEDKAAVDAHNKRVVEIRATMNEAIENDSPEMKGLLILGIAQLQRVNGELEALKASSAAEKTVLETKLKEVTEKLDKIKKSGTPRISTSAPAPGTEVKPAKVDYSEDSSAALDRQLKEAQAAASA